MFVDADGSTAAGDLPVLVKALDRADVAVGSRSLGTVHIRQHPFRRGLGQTFNRLVRSCLPLEMRDTQCGAKAFSREAVSAILEHSQVDGFAFDVEWILIAREQGLAVEEIPVWWEHVEESRVSLVADSLAMLTDLLKIRSRYRRGELSP